MKQAWPTLLLIAALLAPLLPTGLTQVAAEADLETTGVDPGSPAAGAPRNIQATVRNNGPTTVLGFTVTFYLNNLDTPVTGSADTSRVQQQAALAPGQSATATLSWTPTQAQAGAATLLARVSPSGQVSDPDQSNNVKEKGTFIARPGLTVTPSWTAEPVDVEPGADHALPFTVKNTGNIEGTYRPVVDQPDPPGWSVSASPVRKALLPGESHTFVLTVRSPDEAGAGESINETNGLDLEVVQEDYEDSSFGVAEPLVPDVRVAPQRLLVLVVEDLEPGKPSTPIAGSLTIENRGNQQETVTLSRSASEGDVPGFWNITFGEEELVIDAFDEDTTTVQIDLPRNATAGTYELVLVAAGEGGRLPPATTARASVEVEQVHRLNAIAAKTKLSLLPDQEGVFTFELTNTGNGPDNVTASLTKPGEAWQLTPRPGNVSLAAGQTRTVELAVRPPRGAPSATGAPITVDFTTDGGDASATEAFSLEVDVKRGPNLHLVSVPEAPRLDPDVGLTMLLQMVNGGNRLGNATLAVDAPSGWNAFANLDRVESLAPNGTRAVRITITAPEGALPGDGADVELTVTNEGAGPIYEHVLRVVVGGPDLSVKLKAPPQRVASGASTELTVEVSSGGLKAAPGSVVALTAQGNRGTRELARWTLSGLPSGTVETRTTAWNASDWSGTVLLTARVDPDNEVFEENEGNNEATASVFVAAADVAISVPPAMTVDPGQRVQLTTPPLAVGVTNRGNDRARFNVLVSDEGGWIDRDAGFDLAASDTRVVQLVFDVPRPTARLVNNVTVTVTSPDAPGETWLARFSLSVRDLSPPRVTGINLTAQPTWGVQHTHGVLWDDGTGIREGTVRITAEDGNATELPVDVGGGKVSFTWRPATLGPQALVVTLTDLAGNTAPGPVVEANVTSPRGPAIELAPEVRVAPGSFIPVEIASVAPLERVTVRAFGVSTTLQQPYRINTTGWAEGREEVAVNATDTLGQSTERTFIAHVDATQPSLVEAMADPDRADEGEEVRVTLVFDEPVRNATLVLVGEDGLRTSKALRATSDTRWEGTFVMPGHDVERVDVQATDEAGNTALLQGALDLKTKGLPFPGAWALVLVLVGVAWVARARRG